MSEAIPTENVDAWIPGPTAILVVHGVGNQEPLQTLDQFGRGLLKEFRERKVHLEITHGVAAVPGSKFVLTQWLRLKPLKGGHPLDVYEYYWADVAQDRASASAVQKWLDDAVTGAQSFYEQNKGLVEKYEAGKSIFFRKGKFLYWRYWRFLFVVGRVIPFITGTLTWIIKAVRSIPLVGQVLSGQMANVEAKILDVLSNVVGDVVVFNSVQARSPFVQVRNQILDGCVSTLRMLLEPKGPAPWKENAWLYDRVIVTGHSLGSQITFESLNRLNLMMASGQLAGISRDGSFNDGQNQISVRGKRGTSDMLSGYVTFGSPLDKVAFFFREQATKDETIRRRMLSHLRCFKHKSWDLSAPPGCEEDVFQPPIERLLDKIRWINFFDRNDPVSGSLDYYEPVENRNCSFSVKFGKRTRNALLAGGAVWTLALLGALAFWGSQFWQLGWTDLQNFEVGAFLLSKWEHWVGLLIFVIGTGLLLYSAGLYLAGTFTHLRYWNRNESPLYSALIDEFLCPIDVPASDPAELAKSDVA